MQLAAFKQTNKCSVNCKSIPLSSLSICRYLYCCCCFCCRKCCHLCIVCCYKPLFVLALLYEPALAHTPLDQADSSVEEYQQRLQEKHNIVKLFFFPVITEILRNFLVSSFFVSFGFLFLIFFFWFFVFLASWLTKCACCCRCCFDC